MSGRWQTTSMIHNMPFQVQCRMWDTRGVGTTMTNTRVQPSGLSMARRDIERLMPRPTQDALKCTYAQGISFSNPQHPDIARCLNVFNFLAYIIHNLNRRFRCECRGTHAMHDILTGIGTDITNIPNHTIGFFNVPWMNVPSM